MSPPRRSDEDAAQLRAAFVDHARRLVQREGASALTMRALAAEAGCAVGLPYKVFTDRLDLVVEICVVELERLSGAFDGRATGAASDSVGTNLAWFAEVLLDSPAVALLPEVFADDVASKSVGQRMQASGLGPAGLESAVARYIDTEKRRGRVGGDVDASAVAFFVVGAVHNLIVAGDAWNRPSRRKLRRHLNALTSLLAARS
jgi:AcrR family transcriptional regulator